MLEWLPVVEKRTQPAYNSIFELNISVSSETRVRVVALFIKLQGQFFFVFSNNFFLRILCALWKLKTSDKVSCILYMKTEANTKMYVCVCVCILLIYKYYCCFIAYICLLVQTLLNLTHSWMRAYWKQVSVLFLFIMLVYDIVVLLVYNLICV